MKAIAADACVRASLDLDQCRNGVLVEEQVIETPAPARVWLVADPNLALDEQPALPSITVLFADEQIGVICEQLLQDVFGVVGLLCASRSASDRA